MSQIVRKSSFLVSTDVGLVQVRLDTVRGYDIEDVVQDKALSQGRAVQLLNLGKRIDQSKPQAERTIPSIWLNNPAELDS